MSLHNSVTRNGLNWWLILFEMSNQKTPKTLPFSSVSVEIKLGDSRTS